MKQRLEYIDSIKGFAMLLVVMGHVIYWCYSAPENAQSISPTPMLLWNLIYSFHMPLFMFVSGLLFGKYQFKSFKYYIEKVMIKAKSLLIPWLVCSILIYMWRGVRKFDYWYLLTLFLLYTIVGIVDLLVDKIDSKRYQIIAEILILFFIQLSFFVIGKYLNYSFLYEFNNWFPNLNRMFKYFAVGSIIMRHFNVESLMNGKIYSICLLAFCVLFTIEIPHASLVLPFLAIYCCFYLFIVCFKDGRIIEYLKRIGRNSLEIYILHFFFSIKITQVGDFVIKLAQTSKLEYVTGIVIQLVYSLIVSLIIIELSMFVSKIIKTSKLFSMLLLGK